MKSFAILAAVAGTTIAQGLSECSQNCYNNMARIANTELSCLAGDLDCFCNQSNWAYGLRDCTREACSDEESLTALAYAAAQCLASDNEDPDALPILTTAIATASGFPEPTEAPDSTLVALPESTLVPISSAEDDDDDVPASFTSILSSILDDGESAVATVTSAIESATSAAEEDVASVTSELGDAFSSVISVIESATDTDDAEDPEETAAEGAEDEEGAASALTAYPYAAGAGIAAWFFF